MGTFVPEASGDPNARQYDSKFVETVQAIAGAAGIPPSIFDAKGDLIGASAADTAARIAAAAANGLALVSDSTTGTGVKWGNENAIAAQCSAPAVGQTIPNTAFTPIVFTTEVFDTDGIVNLGVSTSKFIATRKGIWRGRCSCGWTASGAGTQRQLYVRKNGVTYGVPRIQGPNAGSTFTQEINREFDMAVNDYIEFVVWHNAGAGLDLDVNFQEGSFVFLGAD